jgi:quinol monooxygenase YgiN
MISLEERQSITAMIGQARHEGARLKAACEVGGIDAHTLQRWETNAGLQNGDGRPRAVRPVPAHALSALEREQILRIANEPRFAALPPARIVPTLPVEPSNQQKLLDILARATDTSVRDVPGFISAALHRSVDGTKVTMYSQWKSAEHYQSMRSNPVAAPYVEQALAIAKFDPGMYEVVKVFAGPSKSAR